MNLFRQSIWKPYIRFLENHYSSVLFSALLLSLVSIYAAWHLPVLVDFSYLLPPNAKSVEDLRKLEKRAKMLGTIMVAVKSNDANMRQEVSQRLYQKILDLGPKRISHVTYDERVAKEYAWQNRWLFADKEDLLAAQSMLEQTIQKAHEKANPLYVDFEQDSTEPQDVSANNKASLQTLFEKLKKLEHEKNEPGELVSKDGTLQMLIVHTPFAAGDASLGDRLLEDLRRIGSEVEETYRLQLQHSHHEAFSIGLTGDIITSQAEHRAILGGMLLSTLATVVLVAGALWLYYRSILGMVLLCMELFVGTLLTFMLTKILIGHLNMATAFLSSIVLGNGINFGIMLLARYMEERRQGHKALEALQISLPATAPGTMAAALTATVAYLSLVVTDFRGFKDFGVIAGFGMLFCWLSAYSVLPASLLWIEKRGYAIVGKELAIGPFLGRLLPKNMSLLVYATLPLLLLAGIFVVRQFQDDPFEADFRHLRSDSPQLAEEQRWMHAIDVAFGQGISGGFVIGTQTIAQSKELLHRLREMDRDLPEKQKLFSRLNSMDDMLPKQQQEKLAILGNIRHQITDKLLSHVDANTKEELLALRPPAMLKALSYEDVPYAMAWPFVEADGQRGRLLLAMSGWDYEIWNAHDSIRFAEKVRALSLGEDVLLGGSAFIFSDMLKLIEEDGPRATLAAMLGAVLVIVLLLGWKRHAFVTLLCGALGTLWMLYISALLGLKINFLDFVALPITVGIGIDYAVNICARDQLDGSKDPRLALQMAGGAVLLSSYTTIVGYGSLLLSANKGIRSFGTVAIIGEFTCLIAALYLAPAFLDFFEKRASLNRSSTAASMEMR